MSIGYAGLYCWQPRPLETHSGSRTRKCTLTGIGLVLLITTLSVVSRAALGDEANDVANAENGDPGAQFALAWRLENGIDIDRDEAAARIWYRRAAEQGHVEAMANLGSLLYAGRGGDTDYKRAFSLTEQAAQRGLAIAQHNVAVLYMTGHGASIDAEMAAQWMESAARQGHPQAMTRLAEFLDRGYGLSADQSLALTWAILADHAIQTDQSNTLRKKLESKLQPQQIVDAERRANQLETMLSR